MYMKYCKVRKDALTPKRANYSDAGLDVYWCPSGDTIMDLAGTTVYIEPGESVLLQTGIKFAVPHGYMLQVCNRSGVASKKKLIYGAHIIDAGYSGEVFINLHNIGKFAQRINLNDKIAQLVLVPVMVVELMEVEDRELYANVPVFSNRGSGSLGSTDNK